MQKVDIFGTGTQAISDTITAQRRVNIIYDFRQDQENNPVAILQTPGLTPYVQLPLRGIRAMWQNGAFAFAVATNGLFLITNNGFTFLGSFGSAFTPNIFEMKSNLTELVMADGTNIWIFNFSNLGTIITTAGQVLGGLSSLQSLVNNMWT
jgi:hypothetical protein